MKRSSRSVSYHSRSRRDSFIASTRRRRESVPFGAAESFYSGRLPRSTAPSYDHYLRLALGAFEAQSVSKSAPEAFNRPRSLFSAPVRVRALPAGRSAVGRPFPGLLAPVSSVGVLRTASICARRGARKEVMHAFGIAGRRGLRKPRRNVLSAVLCRR